MKCNINDFDIERFKTGNYAIHCNTEEKAKELLNYLDEEHCISWGLGTNIKDTGWKTFRGKTCYSYNISNGTLGFCNYQYYKENGIIIYDLFVSVFFHLEKIFKVLPCLPCLSISVLFVAE